MPALYASTAILTAVREANQAGDLQPTTLVSYRAEIEAVFDATDATKLAAAGLDDTALADPTWRDQMRSQGEAQTQRLARELVAQDYNGLLVRSFAKGAAAGDLNLVLWRWGGSAPSRLELIDDEHRLG
jgi:RES domain-containing protein